LKYLIIAFWIIHLNGTLKAQINSNIYLKDGTNFTIVKAFNIGNDSISLQLANKTNKRIAIIDLYKIILCRNNVKIPDSITTVVLVTGIKFAAINAFNFSNGTVNLKLTGGEIKNVPIEMIESFTPIDAKFYNVDSGKLNYSFGLHPLCCGPFNKNAPAFEISGLYKVNALLDLNLFVGFSFYKLNSSHFTVLEHLENFHVPQTKNQLAANKALLSKDYESIERKGNLFKNMIYTGAKTYIYFVGLKIKNYVGLGLNYYFGTSQSHLNASTKWIEYERRISVFDSLSNTTDFVEEPVIARSTQNYTFIRKTFALFNVSYKLKYWVSTNCYLTNEIGLLLGRVKMNVNYEQKNEYQYITSNYYKDETSSKLAYSHNTNVPFNQLYLSIGLYFNK
jgi:hypothetical protein